MHESIVAGAHTVYKITGSILRGADEAFLELLWRRW